MYILISQQNFKLHGNHKEIEIWQQTIILSFDTIPVHDYLFIIIFEFIQYNFNILIY